MNKNDYIIRLEKKKNTEKLKTLLEKHFGMFIAQVV